MITRLASTCGCKKNGAAIIGETSEHSSGVFLCVAHNIDFPENGLTFMADHRLPKSKQCVQCFPHPFSEGQMAFFRKMHTIMSKANTPRSRIREGDAQPVSYRFVISG